MFVYRGAGGGTFSVFPWRINREQKRTVGVNGGPSRMSSQWCPRCLRKAARSRPSISDYSESAPARSSRAQRGCRAADRIRTPLNRAASAQHPLVPAKAGTQKAVDSRLRGNERKEARRLREGAEESTAAP